MLGIPSLGERVKMWPASGQRVQASERTLDSGGRFMASKGEVVLFSEHHLEQLRAGNMMLHPPACEKHDFKSDPDECALCGRTMNESQQYDVDRAKGIEAAKLAAEAPVAAAETKKKGKGQ